MASCEQNNDFPKPDLANAIKPEKNIPERVSQKDGLDYVAPQERNSKQYRPLGSFAQREGKDEAEPELPHERVAKQNPQLGTILDSENKSSIAIDYSADKPNKSLNEINLNNNSSNKEERDVSQNQESSKKTNSNVDMNFAPSIKIGDTVFINSTRQYKNSSLDITGERKSKEDYSIPDNNTHTKKNANTATVDSDNRFVKTNSTVATYGPEKNIKITSEKTIDANAAFISPKEYEDLNVYSDVKAKSEKDLSVENIDDKKQELEISNTKQTSKSNLEISQPTDGDQKEEYIIDNTIQSSKGLKEIDEPKDGDEKGLLYIDENNRINQKKLQDVDEVTRQNEKSYDEIVNNNQSTEKSLYDIGDIIPQGQKGLEEIIYNDNRVSKPSLNQIETNAGSSIDKEGVTVGESELSQKTNLLYNIKTPEHQISENNYDVSKTLRNKDAADNVPAGNGSSTMFNKDLSSDMEPIERKLKDSTNGTTAESFSGFESATNEEIDAVIFDSNKKNYTENVLDKNFISDNNLNSNVNYYDNDFNSIKSNINPNAEISTNVGKFVTTTLRKDETEAVSSIGMINPSDQENNRWNYQTIIENNQGEKVKASGEAVDANSYASIDVSSDDAINQEIYPNDAVNIGSSAIQVNRTEADIKNENYIYNEFSSSRSVDFTYEQQNIETTTPRGITESAESVLNIDVAEQYRARADYTTEDKITGIRTDIKSNTDFKNIEADGFNKNTDIITVTNIEADDSTLGDGIQKQITSRIDYTQFSSDRIADNYFDDIANQGISVQGVKKIGETINPSNLQSTVNAIYYTEEIDNIMGVRTNIKIDGSTGLYVDWNNYNSEFAVYNDDENDNILDRLVITSVKNITTLVGQENYNFAYNIASFANRAIPTNITYGDNESTGELETTETRQVLGGLLLKAAYDSAIVNTVDDLFWTEVLTNDDGEVRLDGDGNQITEVHSSYNGEARQILDADGNIIGYGYYNQENKNFNYSFNSKEGNVASKNSITSNYSPSNIFWGSKEFGLNNYEFPEGNFYLPTSSDYIEGETSSSGLASSRDIETSGGEFNPWWQMLLNVGSVTGINSAINDVSGVISNITQLFNENFYKQFIGTSFSLNNDFGNIMRRFATVDIPVVAGSFLRSHSMMGGQDTLAETLDAVDGIRDLVSTSASAMNQPGAFLANLLRGQSGLFETFTGGGSSMINIATQGTQGKSGGLFQALSNNANASNDIIDSFAVRGSQWQTTPGQTIFNRATTDLGQPYNKDFIVNEIVGNKSIDQILNRKDLAKETRLTEYAAYKTFISAYEGIRELANEDISNSEKRYPAKDEAWDINKFRTQVTRQKASTAKPMTGGTINPFDLWNKNNVYAYLQQPEGVDLAASGNLVTNPPPLIHDNTNNTDVFYDHIIVSSNGQTSVSGDAEWRLTKDHKKENIWEQISSIPGDLKYNSGIIFKYDNYVNQQFHSIGIADKLNQEQIRTVDPHEIEIRFDPKLRLEDQATTKSILLNTGENVDNYNYSGGKRAFISKNKDKVLILLDKTSGENNAN